MTRFMRIVTANVRAYPAMPPADVWEDLTTIADKLEPDLLATQEFWYPRYRRALRRVFPLSKYGHATPRGVAGTCVTWYAGLGKVVETGSVKLHGAVPGVCAWRKITYVVLQLDANTRLCFASTHPTPSAFGHRFSGRKKARVRKAWDTGMVNLRQFIYAQGQAGCTHVALGLDANANQAELRKVLGNYTDAFRRRGEPITYRSNGIDHIVLVGRWDLDGHGRLQGQHSDHDPFHVIARPL